LGKLPERDVELTCAKLVSNLCRKNIIEKNFKYFNVRQIGFNQS
jgi:hypothetical protein